jgi:hypothetical protein
MGGLREDFIHYHVRLFLKQQDWLLLAGQYPGGSDDELPPLNVVDPEVARDNSPDPRRHSQNKLVPDLVALRELVLLVVEMKPEYDSADEAKLLILRDVRRHDFRVAMGALAGARRMELPDMRKTRFVPCLAFAAGSPYHPRADFGYLLVHADGSVNFDDRGMLGSR